MTVVVDSSFVVAAYVAVDPHHPAAESWGRASDEELVTTPMAIAEMDYVIRRRSDRQTQRAFWRNLDSGALNVRWWASGMTETLAVVREHPELGLTDASLVALARMLRTDRLATFDAHFEPFDLTLIPERT